MSKDIKSFNDCFDEFSRIRQSIDETRSVVKNLDKWALEKGISEALAALHQGLLIIAQTTDNLRWYFCSNPIDKYLTGQRLSREEFYLLAAQGIMLIPSESGLKEAYEEFSHYLYEDSEKRGYINPSERTDPPPVPTENGGWTQKVSLTIGIIPEEVKTSFLRPDQRDFFREFKPGLFSRFRKD